MTHRILALLALAPLTIAAPACLIVDGDGLPPPPPNPFGDIAFTWSFGGLADCDDAEVDEVDLAICQGGQLVEQIKGEPCVGGGLVLTEFLEGRYEVDIDAYSRSSQLLYAGGFTVRVAGGAETDVGVVTLDAVGPAPPPPPPAVGSVGFNWTFLYPAAAAIESCAVAGVVDIEVTLVAASGIEVSGRFNCAEAAGATFDNLDVGVWTVSVDAFGSYHDADLHLFGDSVDVVVVADVATDLGVLALHRDETSFADVEAVWSFASTTCADAGLDALTLSVQRVGLDQAEDISTMACSSVSVVRRTFVPGSYILSISGVGDAGSFVGIAPADVAPDTTTQVNIQLTPTP